MRNRGYTKCDKFTRVIRKLGRVKKVKNPTYHILRELNYFKLQRICKCAPKNIMKKRKHMKTIPLKFNFDRLCFEYVHKGDILDVINCVLPGIYWKHRGRHVKHKVILTLRD